MHPVPGCIDLLPGESGNLAPCRRFWAAGLSKTPAEGGGRLWQSLKAVDAVDLRCARSSPDALVQFRPLRPSVNGARGIFERQPRGLACPRQNFRPNHSHGNYLLYTITT